MNISSTIRLNNRVEMPALGLGVWQMAEGEETENAINWALEAGYRHIDTAKLYGNERSVGKAVRETGIAREEIFVTTKLWPTDFLAPSAAFEKSLKRLGFEYIDLYLVHWPIPLMPKSVWRAMEKIYEQKLARAIGVSNYSVSDIEKLLSYTSVVPAVNQIKFSPFDFEKNVLEFCKSKDIVVTAYSPLTRGKHLHDKIIEDMSQKYGKAPAQLLIRWALQHGTAVIPKSSHRERIRENANVFDFEIEPEDMTQLDTLTLT